ncbi:MAG: PA14 domain-containing protein [Bacteroidota bacterium]
MNDQIIRYFLAILLLSFCTQLAFAQVQIEPKNLLLPSGETATFKAINEQNDVQYQWLKNGKVIEGATASTLTYENVQLIDNNTQFQLVIKDEERTTKSTIALLRVTTNNRPYPSIRLAPEQESYAAGDTIFFKGDVTDIEEGVLKATAFTWSVELYQNDKLFSATTPSSGIVEGYFVIPRDGKLSEDAWYRIVLIGTDQEGLSQRAFYDVFPEKSQFELRTSPEGMKLRVEEKEQASPYLVNSIMGRKWKIAAPKLQRKGGKLLVFEEWSDGYPEAEYTIYADENFLMYAIYEEVILSNGQGLLGRYFEREEQQNPNLSRVEEVLLSESDTSQRYEIKEWIGEIEAIVSDWHEFEVPSDGSIRLRIDNQLLIDRWDSNKNNQKAAKIQLKRGKSYSIHVEAKNAKTLALFWSTPDLPRSLVPKNQLFPASDEGNVINLKHEYNPRKGVVHLELSKLNAQQEKINVRILGTQGRTFLQQQFEMGKGLKTIDLDMRFFLPGIYFLEVRGKEFKKVIKIPKR